MDENPIFTSVEEECCFWKEAAKKYKKELSDVKEELDDFTMGSRELEAELEKMLDGKCNEINALKNTCNRMEKERDALKAKIVLYEEENRLLETGLASIRSERDKLKMYIREIEQKNDDLERAHRIVAESVTGMETMLNQAYEKNALLEVEMDEKEVLRVKMQRLMDEARDLKQELNVKRIVGNSSESEKLSSIKPESLLGDAPLNTNEEVSSNKGSLNGSDVIRASSRVAALNLVADLLRKVNSMEAKLKACRTQLPTPIKRHTSDQSYNISKQIDKQSLFNGIDDITTQNKKDGGL